MLLLCIDRLQGNLQHKPSTQYIYILYLTPPVLQTQALRVGQVKEPCIGLTQENSIENSVQDGYKYLMVCASYF